MLARALERCARRRAREAISRASRDARASTRASSSSSRAGTSNGEPAAPVVRTPIPGPASRRAVEALSAHADVGSIRYFVDVDASRGNYVVDADGNAVLDLYAHIASLPVGYNHEKMLAAMRDEANVGILAHRPALGNNPPIGWDDRVARTLMRVAPKGLTRATTMACGGVRERTRDEGGIHKRGERAAGRTRDKRGRKGELSDESSARVAGI